MQRTFDSRHGVHLLGKLFEERKSVRPGGRVRVAEPTGRARFEILSGD
jgi:hypothetical protein